MQEKIKILGITQAGLDINSINNSNFDVLPFELSLNGDTLILDKNLDYLYLDKVTEGIESNKTCRVSMSNLGSWKKVIDTYIYKGFKVIVLLVDCRTGGQLSVLNIIHNMYASEGFGSNLFVVDTKCLGEAYNEIVRFSLKELQNIYDVDSLMDIISKKVSSIKSVSIVEKSAKDSPCFFRFKDFWSVDNPNKNFFYVNYNSENLDISESDSLEELLLPFLKKENCKFFVKGDSNFLTHVKSTSIEEIHLCSNLYNFVLGKEYLTIVYDK